MNYIAPNKNPHFMEEYDMIQSKDVKSFLTDFFSFFKKTAAYIIKSAFRFWLLFFIILFTVISLGYWRVHQQPIYYQAEMVCTYNNLHKKTYGEIVHNLDNLAKSHSYQQLAKELQITPKIASSIIELEAKNVSGSPLYEDVTTEKSPMYFALKGNNKEVFSQLEQALLFYLNHLPYQTKRLALEQKKIAEKINFIHADLGKIDSVINTYSSFLHYSKPITDSISFSNIVELFRYKDQLEDKMLELEKSSHLQESVEQIYGFTPTDNPIKTPIKYWISLSLLALLVAICSTTLTQILKDG